MNNIILIIINSCLFLFHYNFDMIDVNEMKKEKNKYYDDFNTLPEANEQ